MKRTTLSPESTAWLESTMRRNRERFGGLRMMADEPKPDDPPAGDPKQDEPLGEGGKKAIEAEREARKKAEQEFAALRGEFGDFKKSLSEAFGIKPEKGKPDDDTLATIQQQLAGMQHEAAVLRLANEHRITDADDLELLGSTKDAEAMSKLAVRLAKKADDTPDPKKKPGPRPDLSQGPKGEPPNRETLPGVPRMAQAFEDAINNH